MALLNKEDLVSIITLKKRGESNTALARRFGVTESTIRYQIRKQTAGLPDRRAKVSLIEQLGLAPAVVLWRERTIEHLPPERSPSGEALWAYLVEEYDYPGSEKSVRKYLRTHFPKPRLRPFRRIETPPGAQAQTDWVEHRHVDIGDPSGPCPLYGLVMVLSHSRKSAVIWCRSMNQLSWHHAHTQAFIRLGGVPAVNRIDNLKTGIIRGAGPWGEINAHYRTYAKTMGFHVDACLPRSPQQKGKTERRCGVVRTMDVEQRCFTNLEALQHWTDEKLRIASERRRCPVTGTSISAAWEAERALLRPLPEMLPEPFDLVQSCTVHRDCMAHFEGRQYPIPFAYVDRCLEARGCAEVVQFVDPATGVIIRSYPRGTKERILTDPTCYEGEATDRILPPVPLGRMAQALESIRTMDVSMRSVEIYAALAEVAR
jgi:transposase